MRIESIADDLGLVDTIAEWHWDEWSYADPAGSLATWTDRRRERTNRQRIPTTYVALDGEELLGSVTLIEHDIASRRDLSPWLAGLLVAPGFRGQGVAADLVGHAVGAAATMGTERLYLYASDARGFYEGLRWSAIAHEQYEGESVVIMAIDTGSDSEMQPTRHQALLVLPPRRGLD